MNKSIKTLIIGVLLTSVVLTGCGALPGGGEPTPTIDPNMVYTQAAQTVSAQLAANSTPTADPKLLFTQAAQTVVAQITAEAAKNPAATQAPALDYPTATLALMPPGMTPAAPNQPISPFANTSVPIAQAEPTRAEPTKEEKLNTKLYNARLTDQQPPYGWRKSPGASFDMVFEFENTGDAEWNELYTVRWYFGEKFNKDKDKFTVNEAGENTMTGGKTVKKGERLRFLITGMQAPMAQGTYKSNWRFCNNREGEGKPYQCFWLMEVMIVVQ